MKLDNKKDLLYNTGKNTHILTIICKQLIKLIMGRDYSERRNIYPI